MRLDRGEHGGACGWLIRIGLLLVTLHAGVAFALDPERSVRQLPHVWYENQLPQGTVLSIVQDHDGAIWLATYGGLVRYSGGAFETFDQHSTPVFRSTAITALVVDRAGVLWVGTLNGGLYRRVGHAFERVDLPSPIESVLGLIEDGEGVLWMATNAGLVRRDVSATVVYASAQGFPRGAFRGFATDSSGGVFVAIESAGVVHVRDGRIDVLGPEQGLPSRVVYVLHRDGEGTLWVGTTEGLSRYRDGRFVSDPRVAALDGQRVFALDGDRDGNLWAIVQQRGLCRLTAIHIDCDGSLPGLGKDIVRSMFEDREGNLWIGTTNSGVHRISDSKLVSVTGKLDTNSIRAVYEDASGTLWVGTDGAGLARYGDHELQPFEHNDQLRSPFTRALAGDPAGNLWVGSIEGVARIAPDGSVHNFGVKEGLPTAIVFAIAARRDGGVWLGTTLGLVRIVDDRLETVPEAGSADMRALYEAPDGRLWIGQRSGLRCFANGKSDDCGIRDLGSASVFAFRPAQDGALWLGTSLGLMRWRNGVLDRYAERTGMVGDTVFAILEDRSGDFWLSSNRGIARIARDGLARLDAGPGAIEPTWFGRADGMLSQQGNGASQTPAWRAHDDTLWFGTTNGVVMVDPARLRRNLLPPPVAIEHVLADGGEFDPGQAVRFGADADHLEFHYAGMSYVAPEAVRYRYRLEGYDEQWVDAGTRRVAYYTNLPPREYVFRAAACNNDGVWSTQDATFAFTISPHWYETRAFRLLVPIALLVLLAGAYRVRVWRVRANERTLLHEVALRTQELRSANAELRRLASLDGLTRIANRGAFEEGLSRIWDDHRARGAPLAVLLCDIDVFKAYNDSCGHQAGDAALIRVAGAMAGMVRSADDLAARYGGEELALLLSDCDERAAAVVAQRLVEAVRSLAIEHRASDVAPWVTVSIGHAALVPRAEQSPEVIVRLADEALYRAKAQGRDRVCSAEAD